MILSRPKVYTTHPHSKTLPASMRADADVEHSGRLLDSSEHGSMTYLAPPFCALIYWRDRISRSGYDQELTGYHSGGKSSQ
jgi:hypothetical protein